MKSSSPVCWPYNAMRDLLAQPGKDCQPTVKQSPSKMFVVDMDAIPKVCAYFMHHTLDTNQSGSDLMLYLLLTRQPVNIGRIISGDMNEIAQSPKKSLGHANVILMLCQKAGVANLDGRQMVKPARPLDPVWLKENTVVREDQNSRVRATRRPQVDDVGPSVPPRQDVH